MKVPTIVHICQFKFLDFQFQIFSSKFHNKHFQDPMFIIWFFDFVNVYVFPLQPLIDSKEAHFLHFTDSALFN